MISDAITTSELIAAILRSDPANVSGFARIMNPDNPQRIHNQLQNKRPRFTEGEIDNFKESPSVRWLAYSLTSLIGLKELAEWGDDLYKSGTKVQLNAKEYARHE